MGKKEGGQLGCVKVTLNENQKQLLSQILSDRIKN